MTNKFDPHYHTVQSDGKSKILDSIANAQIKGLAALIITDHLNWHGFMNSYENNRKLMKMIRPDHKPEQYPVIIGMELGLTRRIDKAEILVFGTEICEFIQANLPEINRFDLQEFKKLKEKYECGIVQCHPPKDARAVNQKLLPIIDACEITRSGVAHPNYESLLADCKKHGITPLVSSDGHSAFKGPMIFNEEAPYLGKAYNQASIDIKNEKDLIKVIKENLIVHKKYEFW